LSSQARSDEETLAAIRLIYQELGGDESLLASKRSGSDPRIDLLLDVLAVEVDEIQHFTTDRLRTLELYPPDADVLFNADVYRATIRLRHQRADRYRASKTSALVTGRSSPTVPVPAEGATAVSTNDVPP
jgi:hypothetical protein